MRTPRKDTVPASPPSDVSIEGIIREILERQGDIQDTTLRGYVRQILTLAPAPLTISEIHRIVSRVKEGVVGTNSIGLTMRYLISVGAVVFAGMEPRAMVTGVMHPVPTYRKAM